MNQTESHRPNTELAVNHFVFDFPLQEQTPIIQHKLQTKLKEYEVLFLRAQLEFNPILTPNRKTVYQYEILKSLVETGEIDTRKLEKELKKDTTTDFSPSVFNMVCREIREDVENIKKNTTMPDFGIIELGEHKTALTDRLKHFKKKLGELIDIARFSNSKEVMKIRINECTYKISLLEKLLKEGSVNITVFPPNSALEQAFKEIEQYVKSGCTTKLV